MKIKIIDLANKIINDELEDGFKVLKDGNVVLIYNREERMFRSECGNIEFIKFDYFALNKEVEIIEEDKEIEELKLMFPCDKFDAELGGLVAIYNANFGDIKLKLSELIKAVNELKKGK